MSALAPEIRRVLRDHARLPIDVDSLDDQADLFRAGMSSHASVNVMLALEDAFDIEFPDSMLKRSVFESVAGIDAAAPVSSSDGCEPRRMRSSIERHGIGWSVLLKAFIVASFAAKHAARSLGLAPQTSSSSSVYIRLR